MYEFVEIAMGVGFGKEERRRHMFSQCLALPDIHHKYFPFVRQCKMYILPVAGTPCMRIRNGYTAIQQYLWPNSHALTLE